MSEATETDPIYGVEGQKIDLSERAEVLLSAVESMNLDNKRALSFYADKPRTDWPADLLAWAFCHYGKLSCASKRMRMRGKYRKDADACYAELVRRKLVGETAAVDDERTPDTWEDEL